MEAHELLNAAGRAGRAGESGQGFVLVVPSRVVDINEEGTKIDDHWTLLQGVFAQSDQCLQIDDPLTVLLDRIHEAAVSGGNEEYLVARLPTASGDDPDEPARTMLSRSFAAYRKRVAGDAEWIRSRIEAAMVSRASKVVAVETSWLAPLASSTGLPVEMLASLSGELESGAFSGTMSECIDRLFDWLTGNPAYVLQLLRPASMEGLFGKSYKELEGSVEKAIYALPVLRTLTKAWMVGEPLSKLELAAGTPPAKLGTCETARHFVNKVVSDLAFVAGLPARILITRDTVSPGIMVPTVVATLGAAVRGGCDSPEVLANAVLLGNECSRVGARKSFEALRAHLREGSPFEAFEVTRNRVRDAHVLANLNDDL
ncbi:hypothetical protein [Muricoccus aerilatus]|uniref:hypothetical protein n=1 Tax=Muricoccus aerilatus TaxID=452982 RepID=UPI000B0D5194|nr:hypothetical protein [Roseomonas aerilata]